MCHLLAGPTPLVPGLKCYSDALARPTMSQQTRVTEFNAACVAMQLETLDILHVQAHSATAKTQTLNRLKMSGNKVSSAILPSIGQEVYFKRPVYKRSSFNARNPAESPNVRGIICALSTSCCVRWTDVDSKVHETWLWHHEYKSVGTIVQLVPSAATPTWPYVWQKMIEFIHDVQVNWKNTRALREALRAIEVADDGEAMRDLDQLFEDMQLPSPGTLGATMLPLP